MISPRRRFVGIMSSLLALIAITASSMWMVAAQDEDDFVICAMPENYLEANEENLSSLLRQFVFYGDDGIWDSDPDNIGLHFALMQSLRTYYEDQAADLPACAEPFNTILIRVISANQDLLAYNWAILAYPDNQQYVNRANRAKITLEETFAELGAIGRGIEFIRDES